jgi:hypothetical protein
MSQERVMVPVLNILDHCTNLYEFQPVHFMLCSSTRKSNKGHSIITLERVMVLLHCTSTYCAWPFTVLSCFEFQPLVFKLFFGQGKSIKGQ